MNMLGIDISTRMADEVVQRLRKLKTTIAVEKQGEYKEDGSWTKLHVDTEWTEDELDDWLYRTKFSSNDFDYGTFERKNYRKMDGYLFDQCDATPIKQKEES